MYKPNCCTNLQKVIDWFADLKKDGITKDEILGALEFDEDQYPDYKILEQAREVVFSEANKCTV